MQSKGHNEPSLVKTRRHLRARLNCKTSSTLPVLTWGEPSPQVNGVAAPDAVAQGPQGFQCLQSHLPVLAQRLDPLLRVLLAVLQATQRDLLAHDGAVDRDCVLDFDELQPQIVRPVVVCSAQLRQAVKQCCPHQKLRCEQKAARAEGSRLLPSREVCSPIMQSRKASSFAAPFRESLEHSTVLQRFQERAL